MCGAGDWIVGLCARWWVSAGMCRVVFLFCFVSLGCDSSLRCVVCVCVLVVVDWFCLSFFFLV